MVEKVQKHQRILLVGLIALCMGSILAGGIHYLRTLQDSLRNNAVQSVISATIQQQESFDDFFAGDQERLHSYADYLTGYDQNDPEGIQQILTLFKGIDGEVLVMCLDEGWVCGSVHADILHLGEKELGVYRSLPDSGIRDNFIGLFSGTPKFSYYETFTFRSGDRGMIEKTYDRSKILEAFDLSLYDGQGYGYILDQQGNILLRSVRATSSRVYDNVFDALIETHSRQEDIDALAAALDTRETGSITFDGDSGRFLYSYTPLESVEGWCMLSIVPEGAINAETDTILRYSQTMLANLVVILFICLLVGILIWRIERDIRAKDREIAYQGQLFDSFATYLSNNTNEVYMMLDHDAHRVEYVSPNAERVMGVKAEELVDYLSAIDPEKDPDETRDYYAEVRDLKPGETSRTRGTERVNPKTGEHKYFLETVSCVDIQGQSKLVSYISDRTRERQVQNSLTDALQMAQAANRAKTAFLSSVSHDIRTPMNAIIGFLELMRNEADNPDVVREYVQRIDTASQHLLGLINDVLDMNKIESGSATLNISELNLADVIEEINAIIRPQAKAKNQSFDIFVSHLKYEELMGDKLRINQILINLLSNAVKYTPEDGSIQLRVEEQSQVVNNYSRIRFTVSDNGLGMSEDFQKVIFDPFTREEKKATHEIQGTGLGMAITKSLVDLMGGTIRVESLLGEGSSFTVELELRIQEKEDDPGFWNEYKVAKMIVADDDEEVCRNIAKVMSRVGVATDYATDGETSIRMMRERREAGHPYDLILLDWKMPTLDGLETARLIRKNYSDKIPILLLTAYDWSEIEAEAIEIGINHFMPKPFFMSTFKEAIRRVMGGRKKEEGDHTDVVRDRHILVVDDIEVNRIILVKILGSLGAECDTASNGKEAVEAFERSQSGGYDLILMDVQMPVMDGYEATRAIRAGGHPDAKSIPIIAMTANAFVDDMRDAIDAGMDAHIAKPVQIDKLKSTIQQVLDSRQEQADGKSSLPIGSCENS